MWTWQQYYEEALAFAKSLVHLKVTERSAVCIMGFNSPEWVFSFIGGIMANCIGTGIYITNAEEAVFYQTDHSEAEIVVVETTEHLKKFDLAKLTRIKAIVVYGEKSLPPSHQNNPKAYLWKDFMGLGKAVKEEAVLKLSNKQKGGHCCSLIYTSGTTGMPKGCMISHDNATWGC